MTKIPSWPLSCPKKKFFPTTEGYVEAVSGSSYKYIYQYKDHLGNIRLSYKNTGTTTIPVLQITDENNYYPFGLKQMGYGAPIVNSNYKYKYNGKELQDELQLNMYDMEARNYDPALARFTTFDPITHYSQSPYGAFNGNPVYWADPSGMAGEHYNWNTGGYENGSGQSISFSAAMGSYGLNTDGSTKTDDTNSSTRSTSDESTGSNIHPKDAFEYQRKYPRTMNVLRLLRGYVKSNPKILQALAEFSGYSTMEVLSQLKFSEGSMTLDIRDLTWHSLHPEGLNDSRTEFSLEILNAEFLETLKTNEDIQSFSFFVGMTILHEFVHAGRKANNMDGGLKEKEEMGWGWEERSFGGQRVNGSTYKELSKKYNWKFKDENYKYKLPPLF
ncbi:RHS repeat domain-containing protein [Flavobacterium sp. HTF]|uniref:RHS repeat domain-containing protein n=1 Tax=Flavobacterium sp. HTF TaxID=2170732 RepID=UPI001FAF370F|nr:RHS repeat-associated core domain-containing protein [Flavobacterium sp. HTF]